jgi:O-antigen ligase
MTDLMLADDEKSVTEKVFTVLGWLALGGLAILPALPRTVGLTNLAGALGAMVLLRESIFAKQKILPTCGLKICLALFFASAIFSTFVPAVMRPDSSAAIATSLHALWSTVRAAVGAGLCLTLLRKKEHAAGLMLLIAMVIFGITLWAPVQHRLCNFPELTPLKGTRGYENRYAAMLYFLSAAPLALLLSERLRQAEITPWVRRAGYGVALLLPVALLRKQLPGKDTCVAPGPASEWQFILLAIVVGAAALLTWHFLLAKNSRARTFALVVTLALVLWNLLLTGTRVRVGLFLLMLTGAIFLIGKYRRFALPALLLGGVAMGALLLLHPRARNSLSMVHREYIWQGAAGLIKDNVLLGVGYGAESFQREWGRYKPEPSDFPAGEGKTLRDCFAPDQLETAHHAHNLWLELLAERGVIGLLAFHLLWFTTALYLGRMCLRKANPVASAAPAFLLLAFLALEGLLTWSLQEGNEILLWLMIGLALANAGQTYQGKLTDVIPAQAGIQEE